MAAPDWLTARPVAHRGYHDAAAGRLENTLPAVAAAIDRDFAIEVDVRLTGDGRVVVFHDATLDRLTDATGKVADTPLAALREARFRDAADADRTTIPTLEDLLDLVAGRSPLVIELKTDERRSDALERAVADALATYDGPAAVMSFDHAAMARLRRRAPGIVRGLTSGRFGPDHRPPVPALDRFARRHLLTAATVLPHFVAYDVRELPATAPQTLHHVTGLPVLTWTVRTPAERATARHHASQIIFEGFDPDDGG